MAKIKKKTIFIYLLLLIAIYFVIAIIPGLTGALTRTETIEYGDMVISDQVNCYIVRDETVYVAGETATLKHFVEEGTQVKKGTSVLEGASLEDTKEANEAGKDSKYKGMLDRLGEAVVEDTDHISQRKGVLSYYVDGYEDFFNIGGISGLTYDKTKEIKAVPENIKKEKIKKGDPIFKICDNSKWYVVCWIDQADISKYEVGKMVTVAFPESEIRGTIETITEDGKRWQVAISTNRYYEKFTEHRVVEASIRTVDTNGLLVSNRALTTKEDQVGLYVKETTGDFVFVPVQTLITDGEKTLITEGMFFDEEGQGVKTVNVYDQVLKNPKVDSKEDKDAGQSKKNKKSN